MSAPQLDHNRVELLVWEELRTVLWWTIRELKSKDPSRRNAALRRLGRSDDGQAIDAIFTALREDPERIKASAVAALSELARTKFWEVHTGLNSTDPMIREVTSVAFGETTTEDAMDALWRLIKKETSENVWQQATQSYLKISTALDPTRVLSRVVSGANGVAAARVLGELRSPDAVKHLVVMTCDLDPDTRDAAVAAVNRISDTWYTFEEAKLALPELILSLEKLLQHGSSASTLDLLCKRLDLIDCKWNSHPAAKQFSERLIGTLKSMPALRAFRAVARVLVHVDPKKLEFESDNLSAACEAIKRVLVRLNGAGALEAIIPLLLHIDTEIRELASTLLLEINPKWYETREAQSAVPIFLKELRAPYSVQQAASAALVKIADLSILDQLLQFLVDTRPDLNDNNFSAFFPSLVGHVLPVLSAIDANWTQSKAAQDLTPNLISMLNGRPGVRSVAADLLGLLRSREAVAPLCDIVDSEQPRTQLFSHCLGALSEIGDRVAVSTLCNALLRFGCESATLRALGKIDPTWKESDAARAVFQRALTMAVRPSLGHEAIDVLFEIDPDWPSRETGKAVVEELIVRIKEVPYDSIAGSYFRDLLVKLDPTRRSELTKEAAAIERARVEELIAQTRASTAFVREDAARSLSQYKDKRLIGPLLALLIDPDAGVQIIALDALFKVDEQWTQSLDAKGAVTAYAEALNSDNETIRRGGMQTLDYVNPGWRNDIEAPQLLDRLITALTNPDSQSGAAHDLALLRSRASIPWLVNCVETDPHSAAGRIAAEVLNKIEPRWHGLGVCARPTTLSLSVVHRAEQLLCGLDEEVRSKRHIGIHASGVFLAVYTADWRAAWIVPDLATFDDTKAETLVSSRLKSIGVRVHSQYEVLERLDGSKVALWKLLPIERRT